MAGLPCEASTRSPVSRSNTSVVGSHWLKLVGEGPLESPHVGAAGCSHLVAGWEPGLEGGPQCPGL